MVKAAAKDLIEDTFQHSFNKELFHNFTINLLNHIEPTPSTVYRGNLIPDAYKPYIQTLDRLGKYEDPEQKKIDILIVHLKKDTSLERARTMQRNFIAWYLNGSRGGVLKDAALVAFVSPEQEDWRFSFIKMEYRLVKTPKGNTKAKEEFTPAKRYSFLVGENEDSHTAKVSLIPLLINDDNDPLLAELEDAFSIEKVTKEFFGKYRELFLDAKKALDEVIEKDEKIKTDFIKNDVSTVDFCKKLLGQIVFLYFLQKKGWFGVKRGKEWGTGSKHFLRELFKKKHAEYKNFFNDILEPLFYNTLAVERPKDYSDRFDCKIPFLNGGLFDPINDYEWIETDIYLPDELFSNDIQTKDGDKGTGILDVFDRYNFTVKEDEPLEKEVAVDPEMLGKVFENLLEVKDRKSKGTYYTPREIVHYMCQESLINYLVSELSECHSRSPLSGNPASLKEDIDQLIKYGETAVEHDSRIMSEGRETRAYSFKLPESIRRNAELIDEKLATIRVCDPAIGSGAFPLGMMHEIVKARQTLTTYIPTLGKGGEGGFSDEKRTPYKFKRHAIHNCLYGVDIDPGAVEIAKLRLWLSLMVDEEDIKHIKPLPNLDYKIMQGNSLLEEFEGIKLFDEKLISSKPFDETQIKEIKEKQSTLQKEFIDLHNRGKLTKAKRTRIEAEQSKLAAILKKMTAPTKDSDQEKMVYEVRAGEIAEKLNKLHEEFFEAYHNKQKKRLRDQIDALEWELIETTLKEYNNEGALVKLEQFKKSNTKPFFLWKLNFSEVFQEKGGFDVVIANPPYVDSEEMTKSMPNQRKEISNYYVTAKGNWDLYIPFWELCFDNLNPLGKAVLITPNKWLAIGYGKKLREFLRKYLVRLGNCDNVNVFEAGNSPVIAFVDKVKSNDKIQIDIFDNNYTIQEYIRTDCSTLDHDNWGMLLSKKLKLLLEIKSFKSRFIDNYYAENPFTVAEAYEFKDVLMDLKSEDQFNANDYFKFVNTGTIDKYVFLWGNKKTTYLKNKYQFPVVKKNRFMKTFPKRYKQMSSPKIVISGMRHFECMLDNESEIIAGKSTVILKSKNTFSLESALGILNSKLIAFYIKESYSVLGIDGGINFTANLVENLPLPKLNEAILMKIETIVSLIILETQNSDFLNNDSKQLKVKNYEKQIDDIVYELYDLTPEEIAIVEGKK